MRALVLLGICLLWASGCVAGRQGVTSSPLAGTWEALDDARDTLVIRPDGTFDFTRTMWAMVGDVSRLRKAGDYLERPQDDVRFEITESDFTATVSYVRVKSTQHDPTGVVETAYGQYHASLEPDGALAVRAGNLPSAAAPAVSLAVRRYRRIGDAPPVCEPPPARSETNDEWIALGRRQFAGKNWFEELRVQRLSTGEVRSVLLMPCDKERARRLLVVRVKAAYDEFYESDLATSGVDAAMTGSAILHIAIPELSRYGRPEDARVAELAAQVGLYTRQAAGLLRAVRCGLETYDNASYVGHYLWQQDNSAYDGWFCWNPTYFAWYGVSADSNRGKPVLLLVVSPDPDEPELGRQGIVVTEYRARGFRNVQLAQFERRVANWQQQSVRLLGAAVGVEDESLERHEPRRSTQRGSPM
jgi:hypothetical protein